MAYKFSKGSQIIGDLSGSDDSNRDTGIDFEEDYIGFETGGSVSMVLSGSKVGIGTANPDYRLQVAGNIGVNEYIYHNGDNDTYIRLEDDEITLNAGGRSFINLQEASTDKLVINNGALDIDLQVKGASDTNLIRTDAANDRVGIGTNAAIAKLDVAGKIAITAESSTPSQPSDGQGYLYTKSDGKIYWRSYDVSETDLTSGGSGGGGADTFSSLTGASGVVTHNCSSDQVFYHTNISSSFTVNFTNLSLSSGETTEVVLVLAQGATASLPIAVQLGGTDQEFIWKGNSVPNGTVGANDVVTYRILNNSGTYIVLADLDSYNADGATSAVTSGSVLFLDASNYNSYPGSGTTWTDLSGDGKHGTITNGATFSSATKLFTFDGVNDFVDLPDGFADFTSGISMFFVANFGTGNSFERLIDLSNGPDTDNVLFCRNGTSTTLHYDVRDGANGDVNVQVSNGVLNSTLASYAVTDNGSQIKIYRNGALLATHDGSNLPRNVTRTENFLAKSPWNSDSYYAGTMGVAIVYDRALTAAEISQNHNYYDAIYSL